MYLELGSPLPQPPESLGRQSRESLFFMVPPVAVTSESMGQVLS